jgi:hypothetical protein
MAPSVTTGNDPLKTAEALNAYKTRLTFDVAADGRLEASLPDSGGGLNASMAKDPELVRKLFSSQTADGTWKQNFEIEGDKIVAKGPLSGEDVAAFQRNASAIQEAVSGHIDDTNSRNNGIKSAQQYFADARGTDALAALNAAADSRLTWKARATGGVEADFSAANKGDGADLMASQQQNPYVVDRLLKDSHLHIDGNKLVSDGPAMSAQDIANFQRNAPAWREAVSGHTEGTYGAQDLYAKAHAIDGSGVQETARAVASAARGQSEAFQYDPSVKRLGMLSNEDKVAMAQVMMKTLHDKGIIRSDPTAHHHAIDGRLEAVPASDGTRSAISEIQGSAGSTGLDNATFERIITEFQKTMKLSPSGNLDPKTVHAILNEENYDRNRGIAIKHPLTQFATATWQKPDAGAPAKSDPAVTVENVSPATLAKPGSSPSVNTQGTGSSRVFS